MARKAPEKKPRGVFENVPGSGIWYVRYFDQYGRRQRYKVGTYEDAVAEVHKQRRLVEQGRYDPESVKPKKERLLSQAIADYLKESEASKRSYCDDKRYGRVWTDFLGDYTLREVRSGDVERWRREKSRENVAPATLNRHVAFLKRVFNVAIRDHHCEANPVAKVKMLDEDNARLRWLTHEEEARLKDQCSEFLWLLILLAIHTGMRQTEQFSLRWVNVDFQTGFLTLPRTKHGKTRRVKMNPQVLDILRDLPSRMKSEWVFPAPPAGSKHGRGAGVETGHLTYASIRTAFEKAVAAAKLEDFHWHDCRHTFASRLVMKGVDLYTVQELMGHKTIHMTQRYAHLSPDHLAAAVGRLCEEPTKAHDDPSTTHRTTHCQTGTDDIPVVTQFLDNKRRS